MLERKREDNMEEINRLKTELDSKVKSILDENCNKELSLEQFNGFADKLKTIVESFLRENAGKGIERQAQHRSRRCKKFIEEIWPLKIFLNKEYKKIKVA